MKCPLQFLQGVFRILREEFNKKVIMPFIKRTRSRDHYAMIALPPDFTVDALFFDIKSASFCLNFQECILRVIACALEAETRPATRKVKSCHEDMPQ